MFLTFLNKNPLANPDNTPPLRGRVVKIRVGVHGELLVEQHNHSHPRLHLMIIGTLIVYLVLEFLGKLPDRIEQTSMGVRLGLELVEIGEQIVQVLHVTQQGLQRFFGVGLGGEKEVLVFLQVLLGVKARV